jgi:hypothetical protein
MKSALVLTMTFLISLACSIKEESKTSSFNDKYQLELNGCNTGEHAFNSSSQEDLKRQICESLKNDATNNYCASSMRYDLFQAKCQGYNWN